MDKIISFFNSSFFIGLVTLLAGSFAFWLYFKKNRDIKKDAANILLLEIQNAERQLMALKEKLKKDKRLLDDVFIMPTASWDKYQYLFVRDLDRDEWDIIGLFFDKCKLIDHAISSNNSYFQKNEEQIRVNMQRIISDYIKEATALGDDEKQKVEKNELMAKAAKFQTEYLSHPELTIYSPQKPVGDAEIFTENLPTDLSQKSIGEKLKKLSKGKIIR
jgi:hypothetical protein